MLSQIPYPLALKKISITLFTVVSAVAMLACGKKMPSDEELGNIYSVPPSKPTSGVKVYHLGHSLIGRNIPAMLQQLADAGHDYSSQLGWGASLQSHWEPSVAISGFEEENAHDKYRDVFAAIDSQDYDIFVMTEMVEIKDAIKYFDSAKYLAKFAQRSAKNSPQTRIYFYETWHEVTDPKNWRRRLDEDYERYWLNGILYPALARLDGQTAIYIIPVGQVMSAFFNALEKENLPGNVQEPGDLFTRDSKGKLDPIHLNNIGEYLSAVVHYAVIYQQSPLGLSHLVKQADGSSALSPTKEVAELMQRITWEVVKNDFRTGVKVAQPSM